MGLLSYFGIKIKSKPKSKTVAEEIQELKDYHKQLMESVQTDKDDFFDADKFVCGSEAFEWIKNLPNFVMADPTVPESGYCNGKPIYVHPACEPNAFMGIKVPKDPMDNRVVYGAPIINSEWELADHYGRILPKPYVTPNYSRIQVQTKPNPSKGIKVLAGIMLSIIVCFLLLILFAI